MKIWAPIEFFKRKGRFSVYRFIRWHNRILKKKSNKMETFLKRISLNLERRVNGPSAADEPDHGTSRGMLSNASFNDFSMHIGQEGKEYK